MSESTEFQFHIDALHPDTVPMERLALYLLELSKLFGNTPNIHFSRVEEGSLAILQSVDPVALPNVRTRLEAVNDPSFADVHKAFTTLNEMLAKDSAIATLDEVGGSNVIDFPGRNRVKASSYKVQQTGVIEGIVIRIGGKDATSHVSLQDGTGAIENCSVSRELARQLATHLYGDPVRLHGEGAWIRDPEGKWSLDRFKASNFEVLRTDNLFAELDALRGVAGCAWAEVTDPATYLAEQRGEY